MPWTTSTRKDRLPADWSRRRLRILRRDGYACQARERTGSKCLAPATEVDHVVPGDDHRESNLRAICTPCHRAKSSAEGHAAWNAKRIPTRRPPEVHPADRP